MELCILAKVVLLLSIIGISFDIYLFGKSITSILVNVVFTFLVVWITNWSCYNQTYNWAAWAIVIVTLIGLMSVSYLVKNKDNEYEKKLIEEEKKKRGNK
jgi:Kef-type K+ transport system membrane component KefB